MKKLLFILFLLGGTVFGLATHQSGAAPATNSQGLNIPAIARDFLPNEMQGFLRIFTIEDEIKGKMASPNWVKISDIPLTMQQAIISVEDSRFYQHGVVDINGILRAILVNIQAGEIVEGGSTITQQLAKNIFLGQGQTFSRKFQEIIYGILLESKFSKEEILEIYLNTIYFGSGAYGIKDASEVYFHKTPDKLNLAESSMLAGLPAAPSNYSPLVNFDAAKKRQAIVLETMVRNGFIGPQAAKEILAQKLF